MIDRFIQDRIVVRLSIDENFDLVSYQTIDRFIQDRIVVRLSIDENFDLVSYQTIVRFIQDAIVVRLSTDKSFDLLVSTDRTSILLIGYIDRNTDRDKSLIFIPRSDFINRKEEV